MWASLYTLALRHRPPLHQQASAVFKNNMKSKAVAGWSGDWLRWVVRVTVNEVQRLIALGK